MLKRQFDYKLEPGIVSSDNVIQNVMEAMVNTVYISAHDIVVD